MARSKKQHLMSLFGYEFTSTLMALIRFTPFPCQAQASAIAVEPFNASLAACDLHLVSCLIGLQLIGVRLALNRLQLHGARCAALTSTGRRIRRQEARETPTAGVPIQASSAQARLNGQVLQIPFIRPRVIVDNRMLEFRYGPNHSRWATDWEAKPL